MTQLQPPVSEQDFSLGPQDAAVTLVEYGDYDCSHCRAVYKIVEELRLELGAALRFVYRPFPRSTRHSPGVRAAEAALAAGAQGKFWEMHGLLLAPNASLIEADLLNMPVIYREILRLDEDQYVRDLTSGVDSARLQEYLQSGISSGVQSTPTFFINGRRHEDYWDVDTLRSAIELVQLGT